MKNMTTFNFGSARRLVVASLLGLAALSGASAQAQGGELSVTEIQLATQLENGQAVSPTTTFSRSAGQIYAVVRVQNPSGEATTIRVAIEPVGGPAASGYNLEIPARPRYRTVARVSTSNRAPGRYRCVVRTEDGRELSSVELTISE